MQAGGGLCPLHRSPDPSRWRHQLLGSPGFMPSILPRTRNREQLPRPGPTPCRQLLEGVGALCTSGPRGLSLRRGDGRVSWENGRACEASLACTCFQTQQRQTFPPRWSPKGALQSTWGFGVQPGFPAGAVDTWGPSLWEGWPVPCRTLSSPPASVHQTRSSPPAVTTITVSWGGKHPLRFEDIVFD